MMKTLNFTAKVLLAVFVYSSMFVSCYDDSAILERLDKLEGTTVKSIEQQISAINTSITSLQGVDQETKTTLTTLSDLIKKDEERLDALEDYDEAQTDSIEALKEQLSNEIAESKARYDVLSAYSDSLSGLIDHLQTYVDSISAANVDWTKATFSTLAQHDSIVSALVGIKVSIRELNDELCKKISDNADSVKVWVKDLLGDYYDADAIDEKVTSLRSSISCLDAKLGASIDSVGLWVNEQLSGYYDIATMDAKMKLLKAQMSAYADSVSSVDMGKLKIELDSARSQLTAGYKKAISEAISTNNGVIDNKIAKEVSTLNDRIDKEVVAINESIAKLEGRIETLENEVKALQDEQNRKLDIVFSDNDLSCLAGDDLTIGYTIKNGTPNTKVYTLGENGWKGTVKASTDSTGTISVVVPAPYTDGVILVFVNDDANKTAIRSLNFVQGSMTLSSDVVMADTEGDTLSVDIDTDLEYEISVPSGCDWVHFQSVTTRSAMRHEKATFVVDENVMAGSRSAVVDVNRKGGAQLYQITIRQSGATMQANEIWYTSTDGQVVEPTTANAFGTNIVSNTYGKKGVITFEDSITRFGYQAFYHKERLKSISIPKGILSIGESAFSGCMGLTSVQYPEELQELGTDAFSYCYSLVSLQLPQELQVIGNNSFYKCFRLISVQLPKKLQSIGSKAFYDCSSLTSIQLPEKLQSIGGSAFSYCSSLDSIQLPKELQSVEYNTFTGCTSLTSIQLPKKLQSIGYEAFAGCSNLKSISIPGATLDSYCFSQCGALETIHMGARVNYIGPSCFESCTSLKEIHFFNFPLQPCADAFKNLYPEDMTLYVPKDTKKLYAAEDFWKDFKEIIEVDTIEVPKMDFVNLGLSVKWATINIGAVSPEDYGYYYQWGSTSTSADYSQENDKWYDASIGSYTKYCAADSKTELDSEDDVATYLYGNSCRMPTAAELDELKNNCTTVWTTQDGVYGRKVTSNKNGNSIFLPAAGYRYGSSLDFAGAYGNYWSRSLYESYSYDASYLYFNSGYFGRGSYNRYYGLSVRPVASE